MSAFVTAAALDQSKDRVFISPLARRMAEKAGVDINLVPGTGPNGRIVLSDVEKFIANTKDKMVALPVIDKVVAKQIEPVVLKPENIVSAPPIVEQTRAKVASHSVDSVIPKSAPSEIKSSTNAYITVECEVDRLVELCDGINELRKAKVSIGDCAVRAISLAIKQVAAGNLKTGADNIGMCVSTDGGNISPVIKRVSDKPLIQLAVEIEDIIDRTTSGRLRADEIDGAAVVVHNMSRDGVACFAAPVGASGAAVLSINAGEKKAVVRGNKLDIATVMACSLSLSGATMDKDVGADILLAFKRIIERPYMLIV